MENAAKALEARIAQTQARVSANEQLLLSLVEDLSRIRDAAQRYYLHPESKDERDALGTALARIAVW